jgi:hypothetical protein
MKKIIKNLFFALLAAGSLTSCVDDSDTELAPHIPVFVNEPFNDGFDDTVLAIEGWQNINEIGSSKWEIQRFDGNNYAEFSSYQSGDAVNVGWLITPKFSLVENNDMVLEFLASQSFVSSAANKLEVLISTDYDGTNVTTATWMPLEANLPGTNATYFEFMDSGEINLSAFNGENVHIAFKVTGSGTNTALDGSYQIDNVVVRQKI